MFREFREFAVRGNVLDNQTSGPHELHGRMKPATFGQRRAAQSQGVNACCFAQRLRGCLDHADPSSRRQAS